MTEFIFSVTAQEAQLLLDALVELPFKRSADFIFKIQRQVTEQSQEQKQENENEGEVTNDGRETKG